MNISLKTIVAALIVVAAYSCESTTETLFDPGFDYFPIKQGSYVEYEVDSIVHDVPVGVQDTFHYYVKERIDTTFFDLEQRPTARIERYKRELLTDPWSLTDIWTALRTSTKAEKVEENVRYVKLVFPTTDDVMWDGNAQNTLETWDYSYSNIGTSQEIGDTTYARTVTVQQRDIENLIEKEYAQETYAYDVGLVFKQLDTLKYSFDGGVQTLQTGMELRMTAIGNGIED